MNKDEHVIHFQPSEPVDAGLRDENGQVVLFRPVISKTWWLEEDGWHAETHEWPSPVSKHDG